MPTFNFTKKKYVTSMLCALFIVTAAGWVFTGYLVEMATRTVRSDVEDANLIISLNLTNELKKIESAAVAVAGSPLTLPVLQINTPANMEKINNILDRYHKSLDAAACYLINPDGLTLASSNRKATDSFVGQNYTFRSYFQQAIKGGVGRYFAVGTVTGRRGFFASAPVRDKEGQIVGVVTIKKELEDIETKLKQYIWFLVDPNGIIFLSSQPDARLKSLWPLGDEQKQQIILSKQYGPGPFEPVLQKQLKAAMEVTLKGKQYLAAQHATPYEGISVVLLWPTQQISMYRSFGIILSLSALLLTLSFLAVIYIFQRSNFRMRQLLEESQTQALALADSESQLRARKDELEGQKELLAQAEERSRLILGSMGEGIFGLDKEGEVTFVNPTVNTILGYTEEEIIGKSMHAKVHYAYPDGSEFPRLQCPMYLTSQDGKARTVNNEVLWRKDGTAVPVEYSTTPVCKDGQVVGSVVSFRDITERKAMEEKLSLANFLSDQALDLSKAGYWHIPLNTGDEYYTSSERAATIFGDPPREGWRYHLMNEWFANVEAGDKAEAEATMENYNAALAGSVPRYDATYAYKRPIDGRVVWIHAMGHVVRNSNGIPTDMYGVTMDVTERRAMEQQIIEEGERMKKILDTAPVSIAFSTKGRIHFANPLFAKTFGVKVGEVSPQLYVNTEERDALVERLKRGEIVKDFEIKMFNSQKQVRDMLITYMPINYEGEDGILGWLTDISERKQAEKDLKERMEDLERFSRLTINREEKMIQLKEEINTILEQTGREKKYKIVE
jgi:PAS domain S-box-containing protein